jgi:hypothetical protein
MSNTVPRQYSICKFSDKHLPGEYQGQYPMAQDALYIFLGEIPNMSGHCIAMNKDTKKIHVAWPCDLFTELTDDDNLF